MNQHDVKTRRKPQEVEAFTLKTEHCADDASEAKQKARAGVKIVFL